ncbi:MAG TPA: FecR domain-containing protein [Ohtaekwangia sp.]|uniref:FecR family protein n=1 Tax=Ohtaekwangia sp. TaxID=2066019 RepID=UPI002F956767
MERIPPELLQKYLQGKCTPEESERVDAWYAAFDKAADDEHLPDIQQREELRQRMIARIKNNLADIGQLPPEKKNPSNIYSTFYKAAAAILALAVVGLGIILQRKDKVQTIPVVKANLITLRNTTTSILRKELADGTTVWLKPESYIEYPDRFSGAVRTIQLKGEAFFDVAKDRHRPFIVTTCNVTTRVLGTSFNIKAYQDASTIEVSVMTGRVAVQMKPKDTTDSSSVFLTPNERVTYVKSENKLLKETPAQLPELAMWQQATIVYDNVPVRSVLRMLEEKFYVNIQVKNANLNNCLIRADFTNQNLADILELLSRSIEATYELKDNTIYLDGEGCVE